ncbi:hypothetical protein [Marispirochaeta sp.]|uniref:hypothetical protein n=1 Tax=Marispirochaeta sp. TaxID=2038653 RepID=UPI0029C694B3|nr:hypothetical protein [Marispirochaeta sp.]
MESTWNKIILVCLTIAGTGMNSLFAMGKQPGQFDLDTTDYAMLTSYDSCSVVYHGRNYIFEEKGICDTVVGKLFIFLNDEEFIVYQRPAISLIDFRRGEVVKKYEIGDIDFIARTEKENEIILLHERKFIRFNIDTGETLREFSFSPEEYTAEGNPTYPVYYFEPYEISLAPDRNSFFFSGYHRGNNRRKRIYEYSLNDHSIRFVVDGDSPQYIESQGLLYFINTQNNQINSLDLLSNAVASVVKVNLRSIPITDFKYLDGKLFFSHLSEERSFKGVRRPIYKVYFNGELYDIETAGKLYKSPFDVIHIDPDKKAERNRE